MENNSINLNSALSAIQSQTEEFQRQKQELAKGEKGDRGERGLPGRDGRDGVSPRFSVGRVVVGEKPAAELVEKEGGHFELDLIVPVGPQGPRGEGAVGPIGPKGDAGKDGRNGESIVGPRGPQGEAGKNGKDGKTPTESEVTAIVESVLKKGDFRGEKGEPGREGLDEQQIREIVRETLLQTLSDAGVVTEQVEKLVRIRTELKKKIHEVDSRHIGEISDFVKRIDKLF